MSTHPVYNSIQVKIKEIYKVGWIFILIYKSILINTAIIQKTNTHPPRSYVAFPSQRNRQRNFQPTSERHQPHFFQGSPTSANRPLSHNNLQTIKMSVEAVNSKSIEAEAEEFLANPNFCKTFIIPKTEVHEELSISYTDIGCQPKTDEDAINIPTILFHPGMFATRLAIVLKHTMAEKLGVRVITADRYNHVYCNYQFFFLYF